MGISLNHPQFGWSAPIMVLAGNLNFAATTACRNTPQYSFGAKLSEPGSKVSNPGPGNYDATPTDQDRFRRSASWSMPPSRSAATTFKCPGPGTHHSSAPGLPSHRWSFGSAAQRPKQKPDSTPGPGHYAVRWELDDPSTSLRSRLQGKEQRSTVPGPGTYAPSHEQAFEAPRVFKFGSSSRPSSKLNNNPGPGAYQPAALSVTKKSCQRITMQGRYSEPTSAVSGFNPPPAVSTF